MGVEKDEEELQAAYETVARAYAETQG